MQVLIGNRVVFPLAALIGINIGRMGAPPEYKGELVDLGKKCNPKKLSHFKPH